MYHYVDDHGNKLSQKHKLSWSVCVCVTWYMEREKEYYTTLWPFLSYFLVIMAQASVWYETYVSVKLVGIRMSTTMWHDKYASVYRLFGIEYV